MNLKEQYHKETNLEPESLAGTPTTGYVQWLEAKVQSTTPEVSEWVSVDERLPELIEGENYSANVLVAENGVLRVMAYCYLPGEDGGFLWGNCYGDIDGECEIDDEYEPTHWMPLPVPPNK